MVPYYGPLIKLLGFSALIKTKTSFIYTLFDISHWMFKLKTIFVFIHKEFVLIL